MFKSSELVDFCKSMIGMPYWYGTCGYKCSESLLQRKKIQYATHYTEDRMNRYRDDIAKKKVCMDCIGMIKAFFWTNGGVGVLDYINGTGDYTNKSGLNGFPDNSANGTLSWLKKSGCKTGSINTIPDEPGIAVFKSGHVGLYIGNGYVVEAKGFKYGVVKTRLKDTAWVEWAYLPDTLIEYPTREVEVVTTKLGTRNLKVATPYMRGDDVLELQNKLDKLGYEFGKIDGVYGAKTANAVRQFQTKYGLTVDGIFGKKSYAALCKLNI